MYLRVHGSQESRNNSLKKSNFILFSHSFSYKTLGKDSLPTKALLELIYTQNNIAFAVVFTLTSYAFKLARVAVFTGRFHWQFLGRFRLPLMHVQFTCNICCILCWRWLRSKCLLNLCQSQCPVAHHSQEEFLPTYSCQDLS